MADLPTVETLRQLLRYEAESGLLFWKERPAAMFKPQANRPARANAASWNTRYAGTQAGHIGLDGYVHLKVGYRPIAAHRIAWALHYGAWPEGAIDHIDHDPANNRISNLREVAHIENMRNQRLSRANTSGVQGVFRERGKWVAQITVKGRKQKLGRFETIEEAARARADANARFGFHQNHGKHAAIQEALQ